MQVIRKRIANDGGDGVCVDQNSVSKKKKFKAAFARIVNIFYRHHV